MSEKLASTLLLESANPFDLACIKVQQLERDHEIALMTIERLRLEVEVLTKDNKRVR